MSKEVYIAAPFFSNEQIERVEFIKAVLDKQKISYFSPMDVFVCPPDAPPEVRADIFKGNVQAMDACDYMICVTDGKDMGSIWEAGYTYAIGCPILYFCETLPEGAPFNLMMAESAYRVITSREQLESLELYPGGFEFEKYGGNIE